MRWRTRGSSSGCFITVLLGVIFFAVGIGLSWWGWRILQNAQVSESWPSTSGEITASSIRTDHDDDGTTYHAEVRFAYVVDDQRYNEDTVSFGQYGSSNRSHAEEIVSRYPTGQAVTVYYDPADPATAVLEPGVTWSSYMILGMGLLFAIIAVFLLLGTLLGIRR